MTLSRLRRTVLVLAMIAGSLIGGSLIAGSPGGASAQQAAKVQGFPTAEAAAEAFTDAVRRNDQKALTALWGADWRDFVPAGSEEMQRRRQAYLAAWDAGHKLLPSGDGKAVIEVGRDGWTMPVPIVKDGAEWRFDLAAGIKEIVLRRIGYDERGAIQTLLAIVDAQFDYVARDPLKTAVPAYARRLMSAPGRKDGLYWPSAPGEPASPLGPAVARAQADGDAPDGRFGYHFRLLYTQGAAAPGGARDYLVGGRMIGGFAAIAWPVKYGVTGIMTFIVSHEGVVYQRDLGPKTAERAAAITSFNPDKDWDKANMALP